MTYRQASVNKIPIEVNLMNGDAGVCIIVNRRPSVGRERRTQRRSLKTFYDVLFYRLEPDMTNISVFVPYIDTISRSLADQSKAAHLVLHLQKKLHCVAGRPSFKWNFIGR